MRSNIEEMVTQRVRKYAKQEQKREDRVKRANEERKHYFLDMKTRF